MPYRLAIALHLYRGFAACKNRLYSIPVIFASTFFKKAKKNCLFLIPACGRTTRMAAKLRSYGKSNSRAANRDMGCTSRAGPLTNLSFRGPACCLPPGFGSSVLIFLPRIIPQTSDPHRSGTANLPYQPGLPVHLQAF